MINKKDLFVNFVEEVLKYGNNETFKIVLPSTNKEEVTKEVLETAIIELNYPVKQFEVSSISVESSIEDIEEWKDHFDEGFPHKFSISSNLVKPTEFPIEEGMIPASSFDLIFESIIKNQHLTVEELTTDPSEQYPISVYVNNDQYDTYERGVVSQMPGSENAVDLNFSAIEALRTTFEDAGHEFNFLLTKSQFLEIFDEDERREYIKENNLTDLVFLDTGKSISEPTL